MTKDLAPYLMNIHVYVPLFHKLKPILDPPCNYGPSLWWYCGWHHYNLWIVSAELYIKKNNLLGVFNITETNIEQHISISVYFNKVKLLWYLYYLYYELLPQTCDNFALKLFIIFLGAQDTFTEFRYVQFALLLDFWV